ncbi:MFS transporter [Phenylobacterium sp. LjRoot225]|uniref:MFS transporter n=1 Tax=Phenylobacterium sp. LjRoot225 TaxID=3342285 RepID=UPI003ECC285C
MSRIYYGWRVVALAMLIYMLVIGATFSAFGLFVHPVSAELGLSRAEMNTALILMNLGNAAVAPILGRLLDRFPVKWVFLTCAIVLGASLALLGLSQSVWLSSFVLAVMLPIGYLGASSLTMSVLVARWFTAQRGRAMALSGIGMALGGVTVTPIVGLLIEGQGWRTALLIMGAALGAVLVLLAVLLRERPGPNDIEQPGPATPAAMPAAPPLAQGGPASLGSILRSAQFWSIGLSGAAALGVVQIIGITLIPLGRESGLTMIQATSLISVMGGGAIVGALLLSVFADKIDRIVLLTVLLLLGGALNAILPYAHDYLPLVVAAALLGITTGSLPPVFMALLADRFGASSFGTVRGLTMPLIAAMGMIAVRFGGEVFDRTGGYDVMFNVFVVVQIVAAGLMFATRFAAPIKTSQVAASPAS